MMIGSPILAMWKAPADHDTQNCCLDSTLCYALIFILILGCLLWLCEDHELFQIYARLLFN